MTSKIKILVTDGNYKHSLAAVRSLGSRRDRYLVDISSHSSIAVARFSGCCRRLARCPSPTRQFDRYRSWLGSQYATGDYDAVIPVGSETNLAVAGLVENIVRQRSVVPKPETIQMASDKLQTFKKLSELSVVVPATAAINSWDDLRVFAEGCEGKIVVKPLMGASATGVTYIENRAALDILTDSPFGEQSVDLIAQEYIRGEGRGYFGLYDNGKRLAHFMHRRIREFPISGGISVVAESIRDHVLFELGDSIFSRLKWNGPGMLEFKHHRHTGKYTLIEINAKLWGSLELAIRSGVDFPQLIVRHILGETYDEPEYCSGITFAWHLPWSILNFISRFKGNRPNDYDPGRRGHFTDIRFDDILPTAMQFFPFPYYIFKEWRRL